MNTPQIESHSAAWIAQVWISFAVALLLTTGGTLFLPVAIWAKGYILMGLMFTTASAFTLAKTTRDQMESSKLRNRVSSAKTNRILSEFEDDV